MTTITINLPYPPSVNTYYRRLNGRTLISRKGRLFKKEVANRVAWNRLNLQLEIRLDVTITLHPPNRRKRDIDNSVKALLDALEAAGVFLDDSQVDRLLVERGEVEKGGLAVVKINKWMRRD